MYNINQNFKNRIFKILDNKTLILVLFQFFKIFYIIFLLILLIDFIYYYFLKIVYFNKNI